MIDRDAHAFPRLPEAVARISVVGDALARETLEHARLAGSHALITTTGFDNRNVAIAAIGKACGVPRTIARVRDPRLAPSLERLGVEIVCPTLLEAAAFLHYMEEAQHRCDDGRVAATAPAVARPLRIIVAGGGRLGSYLASTLCEAGHHVMIIDRNDAVLAQLRSLALGGLLLEGDAMELDVLRTAGVAETDLMIAAVREESVNLMIAVTAQRRFGVKQVLARVCDPEREPLYTALGLSTICPTVLAGTAMLALAAGDIEVSGDAR